MIYYGIYLTKNQKKNFFFRLAIIGLTDQYIHNRIDEKIYNQLLHLFKDTISFQNLPHIFGFDKRIICENEVNIYFLEKFN